MLDLCVVSGGRDVISVPVAVKYRKLQETTTARYVEGGETAMEEKGVIFNTNYSRTRL
jgi:hypothetical protein